MTHQQLQDEVDRIEGKLARMGPWLTWGVQGGLRDGMLNDMENVERARLRSRADTLKEVLAGVA